MSRTLLLIAVLVPSIASAEAPAELGSIRPTAKPAPELPASEQKSAGWALTGGVATAVAGVALVAAGGEGDWNARNIAGAVLITASPYVGYAYTGDGRAAKRVAIAQAIGLGCFVGFAAASLDFGSTDESPAIYGVLALAGGLVYAGAGVFGIADGYRSAERVNEKRRDALHIAPVAVVGPDRSTGAGVGVSGSF